MATMSVAVRDDENVSRSCKAASNCRRIAEFAGVEFMLENGGRSEGTENVGTYEGAVGVSEKTRQQTPCATPEVNK